jgi:hypothetical protein
MPDDSVQLLTALDRAVRQHLCPFFTARGASYTAGMSSYDGYPGPCTLKSKPFASVGQTFFWWIHRFSSSEAVLDIGFGDREFIVETTLFYPSINARFAPWELLLAHEVHDSQAMSGNAFVLTTDFMERTIIAMAEGIQTYWPILSVPDPVIVDRAQTLRGRRMIFAQEEQRKKDRERASIQASLAFHARRFGEAIKLLAPFKDDEELSRSSKMLLHVAQKKQQ